MWYDEFSPGGIAGKIFIDKGLDGYLNDLDRWETTTKPSIGKAW